MTDLEAQAQEFLAETCPRHGQECTICSVFVGPVVAFARRVRAEALAERLSADDVVAAINAARKEARAEALLQAAAVARAKGYKHAETVDKSHARRLVRRGAEAVVVALDALAEAEPAP